MERAPEEKAKTTNMKPETPQKRLAAQQEEQAAQA
jgi:hypothetical protein